MERSSGFIFMLVCIITVITVILIVNCEEENYFEVRENPEEVVNPHSFFYDKQTKTMIPNAKIVAANDIAERHAVQNDLKNCKQADNDSIHKGIFYKRLINLLLSNIYIKDENEMTITGILEIEVTHSQMEILKNFNADTTSLREIDEILSNIIKNPAFHHNFGNMYIYDTVHKILGTLLNVINVYPNGTMIVVAMLVVCWSLRPLVQRDTFPLSDIMKIIFILSFFMYWWHLLQEAEIKMAAAQMKFSKMPISCQPDKMTMWDKFVSFFYNDDCEQYYKTVMSNPKLKVTPATALVEFFINVFLNPLIYIGTVISGFIHNATEYLPWTYGWLIKLLLYLCIGIVIMIVPLCLFGASFNLSIGPLLKFGIGYHKENKKGNSLENIEKREPVQVILQVSQDTNVPQIKNNSETEQSKTLQVLKDSGKTEVLTTESNDQEYCDDLGCGDTIKNNELPNSDEQIMKELKNRESVETDKNDGRGDG